MNSDTFQDRLKLVMGGESNHSFAIKCNISEGSLRNYLKGGTSPDLKTLQVIAEVSGYSLAWLVSGEGKMRGDVTYLLGETLKTADITSEVDKGQTISQLKLDLTWFHDWIDEELQGKSMSEIMAIAVKMKTVLDENKGG